MVNVAIMKPMSKHIVVLLLSLFATLSIPAEDKAFFKKTIDLYPHNRAYSVTFGPKQKIILVGSGKLEYYNFEHSIITSSTFTGDTGGVNSIVVAPDGTWAASANNDTTIKLWSLTDYKEKASLQGHTDRIKSVAFSSDYAYLVSAGFDKTSRIWDIAKRRETMAFTGHVGPVFSAIFMDNNKHVISGGLDIFLWDASTGKQIKKFGGNDEKITSMVVTSDGKFLISASYYGNIKIWNISSGSLTKTLVGHKKGVFTLALNSNGKYLLSGDVGGDMKLWELPSGKALQSLQAKGLEAIYSIAISSDDKYAASVGESSRAFLWDLKL